MALQLLSNRYVQSSVVAVQRWCKIVFGDDHALNTQMAKVHDDPKNAEEILLDVTENPKSIGPFAGRKVFGIESQKRKDANRGWPALCFALESI